MRLSFNLLNV